MDPVTSATLSPWTPELLSFGFYVAIVLGLLSVLLFLTGWLGEKKPDPEKARPYECGVIPTGWPRFRYPVPFFSSSLMWKPRLFFPGPWPWRT
jgi:NADH-quinone oxidoreductase subunit A